MNVVRNMRVPALATLLLIALSPALAWADMDTGDALATFFLVFLGEAVAVAVGLGAVIAALLLRSRAVWVFALLMAAANGVMGAAVLFQGAGRLSLFTNLASLQVTLALFACPSLVAWRRTEREDRAPVAASLHTPHWLLL
jgi:hypothetical protein